MTLLLTAPLHASAQTNNLTLAIDSVFTGQYPGVLVYATVRDANGVPVAGLTAENFEINEDRAPKAIPVESVETQINADSGIWAVMAIDVSSSMAGRKLEDAKAAAVRFLDTMTDNDHIAVYAFSDSVNLDAVDPAREVPFTTDRAALKDFIAGLQSGSDTPLYDAAYKSVLMLDGAPTTEPRALLLFTDGRDEGSQVATVDTAVVEAQNRRIPVFTIGLGDADTDFIKELSRRTGGDYQSAADSTALTGLFEGVATRLKTQYVLSYVSALPADGQPHKITVIAKVNGSTVMAEADTDPLPFIPTETPAITPTIAVPPTTPAPVVRATQEPAKTPEPSVLPTVLRVGGIVVLILIGLAGYVIARTRGKAIK